MTGYFSRLVRQTRTNTTFGNESIDQNENLSAELRPRSGHLDGSNSIGEKATEDMSKQSTTKELDIPNTQNEGRIKIVKDKTRSIKHTSKEFDSGAMPSNPNISDVAEDVKIGESKIADSPETENKKVYTHTSKVDVKGLQSNNGSAIMSEDDKKDTGNVPVFAGNNDMSPELLFEEVRDWISIISNQNKLQTKNQNSENIQQPKSLQNPSFISDTFNNIYDEKVTKLLEPRKLPIQDYRLSIGNISVNVVTPPDNPVTNLSIRTQDKRESNTMNVDKSYGSRLSRYYVRLK